MICPNCKSEVRNDSKYCENCGYELETVSVPEVEEKSKCWDVFANLGWIFGLLSLVVPIAGALSVGVPGIVFSCLGKKSDEYAKKAKAGFTMSIVGLVVYTFIYIIIVVIIAVSGVIDVTSL